MPQRRAHKPPVTVVPRPNCPGAIMRLHGGRLVFLNPEEAATVAHALLELTGE
ncbi:hypothetical protein TPB0596_32130 [Tsukamurella pulmonis]|nr:hypothetical protein TPB0596_32130 [Tsukamurella pulmonis]